MRGTRDRHPRKLEQVTAGNGAAAVRGDSGVETSLAHEIRSDVVEPPEGIAEVSNLHAQRRLQVVPGTFDLVASDDAVHRCQVDVGTRMGAHLHPCAAPLAQFSDRHQWLFWDADLGVPAVGVSGQAADRIASCGKVATQQYR